jgi:hypothetical protein
MPQSLSIAAFVLGAILLLVALYGGDFKVFGAEMPGGVSGMNRKIALVLGLTFIVGAFFSDADQPNNSGVSSSLPKPPAADVKNSGVPPSLPKPPAADVYVHASGSFERQGEIWVEYPPYAPGRNFRFKEALRDDRFIYLYDDTRHKENDPVRVFYLRLPVSGGMAEWSYPNPFQWQPLYPVRPKTR